MTTKSDELAAKEWMQQPAQSGDYAEAEKGFLAGASHTQSRIWETYLCSIGCQGDENDLSSSDLKFKAMIFGETK